MASFDNLPFEIFAEIFSYLDLNDLFNFRLVCKQMNQIVHNYRPKELNFVDSTDVWFYENRPIDLKSKLDSFKVFILNFSIFDISCLKHLKISLNGRNKFKHNLKFLSNFNMLNSLEICHLTCMDDCVDDALILPNLRSFYLNMYSSLSYPITIDTPNLQAFSIQVNSKDKIIIKHPSSIRYLQVAYDTNDNTQFVTQFTNLIHLVCKSSHLKSEIFSFFSRLNTLQVDNFSSYMHRFFDVDFDSVKQLLVYKIQNKIDNLNVYYRNILVSNYEQLEEVARQMGTCDHFYNYLKFYERLIDGIDTKEVKFANIITEEQTEIPIDFFVKFPNIQILSIGNHHGRRQSNIREDTLIDFVYQCKSLKSIRIFCQLPQLFYDRLPFVSNLTELEIKIPSTKKLTFTFLNNIRYLKNFITWSAMTEYEDLEWSNWPHLKLFEIKLNRKIIRIGKKVVNGQVFYNIYMCKKLGINYLTNFNANELAERLNFIKTRIFELKEAKAKEPKQPRRKKPKIDFEMLRRFLFVDNSSDESFDED